ncbi:MAG: ABC transporter substrate-binding protein [Lachnospiraceae bacterium]|nr:ABC transporter substrate-binding protein [Lachnospiraceae bacterium]
MKRFLILVVTAVLLCGCSDSKEAGKDKAPEKELITVGFSQVGSESDWRMASTTSVRSAFEDGDKYNLIYDDAQQKQENQIKAIRKFIDQDVDYILLDPITESGWDSALQEARDSGIPVIVCDRRVAVADNDLYTAWIGSDFELEGKRACEWLKRFFEAQGYTEAVNIVHIQGTLGASAQIGRSAALEAAVRENPTWRLLDQQTGEFTQARGREVMEDMLKHFGDRLNLVFCENDNEAYGAIEAIRAAGRKTGTDIGNGEIMIVSFDSTRKGLEYTLDGTIALNTECSPLYGPRLTELVDALERGEKLSKETFVEEGQFSIYPEVSSTFIDGKNYEVMHLTQEVIDERAY